MSEQLRLCCADCTCTNSHSGLPLGPNGEWITVLKGPIISEPEPTPEPAHEPIPDPEPVYIYDESYIES
jgi:hypothetical protein